MEQMFTEAVRAYLFPILEEDKAAYKMVADQMKAVLLALGWSETHIALLNIKAKNEKRRA